MSRELKQERSIPVQSRIDIKSIAELDAYWTKQGVLIKSMSQLLSWSIDLCHEVLSKNGMIKTVFESVADCHNHLEQRGLYQKSLKKRSIAKVNAAMRFENLRFEGVDPSGYDAREYNMVHNSKSVDPYKGGSSYRKSRNWDERTDLSKEERERFKEIDRAIEEEKRRLQKEETERQKANAMKSGRVVSVESKPVNEDLNEKHERLARQRTKEIEENDMMPPGYEE